MAVIQQQPTFNQQAASIAQQKQLAELLRKSADQNAQDPNAQTGGPYSRVIPIHPLAAALRGLESGVSSYMASEATKQQGELEDRRLQATQEAFAGGQPDYQKLAGTGAVSPDVLAKMLVDKQTKEAEIQAKIAERQARLSEPTTSQRDALWATGGNEEQARQLLQNKIQNPLGMLNYQLNAQNASNSNARADESLRLQQEHIKWQQEQANRDRADKDAKAAEARLQNVPPTHRMAYAENNNALSKIDNAIKLIEENPDALGLKNMLGDTINQRLDENGVPVRAAIAEIGGVKLHDLSGAAVAPSESARLMPLIPMATDSPEAAKKKLQALRNEYIGINSQIEDMYGDADYRNPIITPKPASNGQVNIDIQEEEWLRMPQKQRRQLLKDIEQQNNAPKSDPFAGFTPEQKAQFLKEHPDWNK